jgi:hypothetical protein
MDSEVNRGLDLVQAVFSVDDGINSDKPSGSATRESGF